MNKTYKKYKKLFNKNKVLNLKKHIINNIRSFICNILIITKKLKILI